MRKYLITLAFSVSLLSTPSFAQDWSGFYVGAHAGYGWGDGNVDLSGSSGAIHWNDPFLPGDQRQNFGGLDGWLGGLHVGANYQTGLVIVGLEADVSWSDIGDDLTTGVSVQGAQWDIKTELDAFGTVRGRLGFLVSPTFLVYGTAGAAWGQFDVRQATTFLNPPDDGGRTSGSFNHFGYVVGGGAEWALGQNLFLRAEYLYLDFGKEDYALKGTNKPPNDPAAVPYIETFSAEHELHTLRVGVSYKFGARESVVPLK